MAKSIGERIKRIRELKGIKRSELARLVPMPYSTLAELENGGQSNTTKLPAIARALRVTIEQLENDGGPAEAGDSPPAVVALSEREEELLRRFRAATPAVKRAIEGAAGRHPDAPDTLPTRPSRRHST